MKMSFADKILSGIQLFQKMQQLQPVFRTSLLNATR